MMSVWKYPLLIEDEQLIHPPKGAQFMLIAMQDTTPTLWALVDTDRPQDSIRLITKGTGHPIGDKEIGNWIGSYQTKQGLVFHVFHTWASTLCD